jgi:signal peptidase I
MVVAIVLGLFWGAQLILNTPYPTLTVETGSMCIDYDSECDSWTHPFNRTLHVGDILIVQGIDPSTLNTNYPNSDVIVFHEPSNPNILIVHRIAAVQNINGVLYFQTKGDGNGGAAYLWPATPNSNQYDHWDSPYGIPQDLVVGKVVGRVPWVGNLTLFLRKNPYGLPVAIVAVILLVVLEFAISSLKNKPVQQRRQHRHA